MFAGGTWIGRDGTPYRVVKPADVKPEQARWWIDEAMLDDYSTARNGHVDGFPIGPDSPFDLHYLGTEDAGPASLVFALVEMP
jgi:hypothetical protein